ncbi:MAG: ABC transporter substrate-binding protein [Thermodesulfobacteriota bacterium]
MRTILGLVILFSLFSSSLFAQEKTTLNWIGHWKSEYGRENLVWEVKKEFEFINGDVTLNLKFPDEIMGFRSKKETAEYYAKMIKSGNFAWDIIWLDDQSYRMVAEELNDFQWGKKYLVDFEKEVPGFKERHKSFIIDSPEFRNHTGGTLIGPYVEGCYYILWYNKSLADKMGITIKEEGMLFDDLLSYFEKVSRYNEDHGTAIAAIYGSSDFIPVEYLFQNLFKSEIGDLASVKEEKLTEKKKKAYLKTLQAIEELGKHRGLIESYSENIWFDTRELPLDDKCLFYVAGSYMYSHWMGLDQEKTQKMYPAELPVFREIDFYLGTYIPTWGVLKDSPHKKEAVDFLMYWAEPKIAEKWVWYTKTPTGLKGDLTSIDLADDRYERFNSLIAKKYGKNIHHTSSGGYVLGRENQLLKTEMDKKFLEVLAGKITAQAAYDAIMGKVK